MAELLYDASGRLLFTKEMKQEYTLLMPQMLPVTFTMMKKVFELDGYKIDMLTTHHRGIVDTGLKYVHNDTCYPALLVIGQLIEAVRSGELRHAQGRAFNLADGRRLPRVQLYSSVAQGARQGGAVVHTGRVRQFVGTGEKPGV